VIKRSAISITPTQSSQHEHEHDLLCTIILAVLIAPIRIGSSSCTALFMPVTGRRVLAVIPPGRLMLLLLSSICGISRICAPGLRVRRRRCSLRGLAILVLYMVSSQEQGEKQNKLKKDGRAQCQVVKREEGILLTFQLLIVVDGGRWRGKVVAEGEESLMTCGGR
jgi:hypothetical protein